MGEICRFGTNAALKCILSATQMRGMRNLTITGETTAEAATSGSQEYMKRKSGKPVTVSFEVILSAFTGCNTQSEAISLITAARDGQTEYLYVGGSKLVPCRLMLTRAEAKEFILTPKGKMAHCVVSLTFQQASNNDGSTPGSSSSSGKKNSSSSSGWKQYTVYVPGRGTKKVQAGSPTAALNAAFPGHTGTYYVDGVAYRGSGASTSSAVIDATAGVTANPNKVVNNAQKNSTAQKSTASNTAKTKTTTTAKSLLQQLRAAQKK